MRLGAPVSRSVLRTRLAFFDLFWAIVAPFLALALRDPGLLAFSDFPPTLPPPYQYALVTIVCAVPAFVLFRISESMSRFFSLRDALSVCGAVATAVGLSSVALFVFTRLEGVPRSTPLICGLVMTAGLILSRVAGRLLDSHYWAGKRTRDTANYHVRRVILVGVDRFAAIAIRLIDSQRPRTTLVIAALDPRPAFTGRMIGGVKIIGAPEDIGLFIDEYAVHGVEADEVWISDDTPLSASAMSRVRAACDTRQVRLVRLSQALNLAPTSPPAATFATTHEIRPSSDYFAMKRPLDILAASVLIVVFSPIAAVVAAVTKLDVGSPILFWQQRVGVNGRKFLLYKFRTLRTPFDRNGVRVPEDQRLSAIGKAIRASRLDEIPQLWNVVIGDMSLVGPRPLLPRDQPKDPRTRLLVRPGITGWAQINGGAKVSAEEKDALDAWYVRHASFALDLQIVLSTMRFIFTGEKLNPGAINEAKRFRAARQETIELHAPLSPLALVAQTAPPAARRRSK